jgi:tetratricopeptide (TPR) repeat protein
MMHIRYEDMVDFQHRQRTLEGVLDFWHLEKKHAILDVKARFTNHSEHQACKWVTDLQMHSGVDPQVAARLLPSRATRRERHASEQAAQSDPTHEVVHDAIHESSADSGQAQAAHAAVHEASALSAGADGHFQAGRYAEAEAGYKSALSAFGAGVARVARDELSEEVQARVQQLMPTLLHNLGLCILSQHHEHSAGESRIAEAVKVLEKAAAISPTIPQLHFSAANALFEHSQRHNALAQAQHHYKQVLALDPKHEGARENLATLLEATKAKQVAGHMHGRAEL